MVSCTVIDMPYKFIDGVVVADITFEASGKTLEEIFESSANAVTSAMIDKLEKIEAKEERKITHWRRNASFPQKR